MVLYYFSHPEEYYRSLMQNYGVGRGVEVIAIIFTQD
jgi:hypothetical protein